MSQIYLNYSPKLSPSGQPSPNKPRFYCGLFLKHLQLGWKILNACVSVSVRARVCWKKSDICASEQSSSSSQQKLTQNIFCCFVCNYVINWQLVLPSVGGGEQLTSYWVTLGPATRLLQTLIDFIRIGSYLAAPVLLLSRINFILYHREYVGSDLPGEAILGSWPTSGTGGHSSCAGTWGRNQ